MCIKEDIPKKELYFNFLPSDIEIIIIELNKNKDYMASLWLLSPSQSDEYFFYHLGKALDNFSTKYDHFVLLSDFNVQENKTIL